MKRLLLLLPTLAVFILVVGGVAATGAPPTPKKTTICHWTGKKYVKISVGTKSLKAHMGHHTDVMPAPAGPCPSQPQNAFKANGRPLKTTLTGAAEVPGPGDPNGTGTATIRLNQGRGKVCFVLTVSNITLPATGAHIHVGSATQAGPIVVGLAPPDATGMSGGCVDAPKATIRAIRKNSANYYVNVHTSDFPAGAIRGQL